MDWDGSAFCQSSAMDGALRHRLCERQELDAREKVDRQPLSVIRGGESLLLVHCGPLLLVGNPKVQKGWSLYADDHGLPQTNVPPQVSSGNLIAASVCRVCKIAARTLSARTTAAAILRTLRASRIQRRSPVWVKMRRTRTEHIWSALALESRSRADVPGGRVRARSELHVPQQTVVTRLRRRRERAGRSEKALRAPWRSSCSGPVPAWSPDRWVGRRASPL
jgi:hypothetical protein